MRNHVRTLLAVLITTSFVTFAAVTVAAQDETARKRTGADHLRQIYQAMVSYAADHKGHFPPELGTFARVDMALYKIEPALFLNPAGGKTVPENVRTDPAALANWLNRECDVQYALPPGTRMNHVKKTTVVLILKPAAERDALTVAFADATVVEYRREDGGTGTPQKPSRQPTTAQSGP